MPDSNTSTPPSPAQDKPCEVQVARVMRDLGLTHLQARNHVRCLEALRAMPDPRWQKHD